MTLRRDEENHNSVIRLSGWKLVVRCLWGVVPSLVLIFLVLGTILMGLATPTEGGAMGALGAVILAAMHNRLSWKLLWQGAETTMRITAPWSMEKSRRTTQTIVPTRTPRIATIRSARDAALLS